MSVFLRGHRRTDPLFLYRLPEEPAPKGSSPPRELKPIFQEAITAARDEGRSTRSFLSSQQRG